MRHRTWTFLGAALLLLPSLAPGLTTHAASAAQHFWVATGAGPQRYACVLQGTSAQVALYTCGTRAVAPDQARALMSDLEHHIIPTDLQLFGRPRNFGKLDVLLAPLDLMTLGYFDENDIIPSDPAHSNHADVIYVRPPYLMPDASQMADVEEAAAHELQHLINFRIRVVDSHLPRQQSWLSEGLAFYAQMANGYWTRRDVLKVRAATRDPGWSINRLIEGDRFLVRHARVAYGRAGLFICDLVRRFGSTFANQVIRAPGSGLQQIDRVLRSHHRPVTVSSAFAQWGADLVTASATRQPWVGRLTLEHIQEATLLPLVEVRSGYPPWSSPVLRMDPWSQSFVRFRSVSVGTLRVSLKTRSTAVFAALIATSSEGLAPPRTIWFRPDPDGVATAQISEFGKNYDVATLAISNAPPVDAQQSRASFLAGATLNAPSQKPHSSRNP